MREGKDWHIEAFGSFWKFLKWFEALSIRQTHSNVE
jgi:hypothetical protein